MPHRLVDLLILSKLTVKPFWTARTLWTVHIRTSDLSFQAGFPNGLSYSSDGCWRQKVVINISGAEIKRSNPI